MKKAIKEKEEIILYAKKLISHNTNDAIEFLEQIIQKDSSLYSNFILQKKRYLTNQEAFHNGRVNYEAFSVTQNQATLGLLTLIERLTIHTVKEDKNIEDAYFEKKEERANRIVKNQLVKIDDQQKNLNERNLRRYIFVGAMAVLGLTFIIIDWVLEGEMILEWPIYMALFIFVLTMITLARTLIFYFKNQKKLPRKRQQLELLIRGNYNEVFDSLFHSLLEMKSKVTDYDREKGVIEADILNLFFLERLFATFGGERLVIILRASNEELIEIKATSTSRTVLASAHEADFFKIHQSINRKNLNKLQKSLVKNLSK